MLDDDALILALQGLPTSVLQGTTYRIIKNKYASSPLSSIGSLRGGRYNPPDQFEALYIADSPNNALLEIGAMIRTTQGLSGVKCNPLLILSLDYRLNRVLNLFEDAYQSAIGTNLQELTTSWRDLNADGQMAATQKVGWAAYKMNGIEALKVPSAKIDGAYNLVIFPNKLSGNSFVKVYDEDGLIVARVPPIELSLEP
jgi:RES domain-containing protein